MKRTETDHVDVESLVRPSTVLGAVSRYDLVLGVLPLLWLAAAVGASVTALSIQPFLGAAGVASALVLVDALYRHPPTRDRREPRTPGGEAGD